MLTLGADPEIFFACDGKPVSAIGLIGGSKEAPLDLGDGFAIQEDNVAAEFNVPPATTHSEWDQNIERGLHHVIQFAERANLYISPRASADFEAKELDHPKAKEFGCDPDFNAWTYERNPRPTTANDAFRTCGGHVHVGGVNHLNPLDVIRAMDLYLGVPSVILDADKDRRSLYGKAGAYRMKPYGVEYRTLSNFWVFDSRLRLWVWQATNLAVEFAENNRIDDDSEEALLIQETINNSREEGYYQLAKMFPEIAVH